MSMMRKNIFEVPELLKQIESDKEKIRKSFSMISDAKRIILAGSGSSYHAAQYGMRLLEDNGFHAVAKTSADFETMKLRDGDAVIAISVSGTKGDFTRIVEKAKKAGARLWIITSNSRIDHDNAYIVPTGIKSSFINTHAYIGQLAALYFIFNDDPLDDDAIDALSHEERIKDIAKKIYQGQNFVFLSCGYGMIAAEQSALKLREVATHIKHSEALSYDELPHGRLFCLGDNGTVFITLEYNTDHIHRLNLIKDVLGDLGCETIDFGVKLEKSKAPIILQIMTYLLTEDVTQLHGLNPDEPENVDFIKNLLYEKTKQLETNLWKDKSKIGLDEKTNKSTKNELEKGG
jgi:glucosamine 6-phosphate synthetase-like amidotransferase/phosphosugar isomerase protein